MTKQNSGGPAFPTASLDINDGLSTVDGGMTLRDYFAGQALAGFIQSSEMNGDDTAENAYAFADAMLLAREE